MINSKSTEIKTEDRVRDIVRQISSLKSNHPQTLIETIEHIESLTSQLRTAIGLEIAQVINDFKGQEIGNLSDKRVAAKALNDTFDGLGLRIKCPRTGAGAVLIGSQGGEDRGRGRFELVASNVPGGRSYSARLPEIEPVLKDMHIRRRSGRSNSADETLGR